MEIQVKLLRTLENREIERLGGNKPLSVDFRLITATNKNLEEAINKGTFRKDFFYRINTIETDLPALRERREDLPDLIKFFVNKYMEETGREIKGIEPQTMKFLLNNKYVGNVRELKNIIERMAILSGPEEGSPEEKNKAADRENETNLSYRDAKQQFEREYLSRSLEEHDGNITRTAEAIGMSRRQLFNKISELGIDKSIEKHN